MHLSVPYHASSELIERSLWCTIENRREIEVLLREEYQRERKKLFAQTSKRRKIVRQLLRRKLAKQKILLNQGLQVAIRHSVEVIQRSLHLKIQSTIEQICTQVLGEHFNLHKGLLSKRSQTLLQRALHTKGNILKLSPNQRDEIVKLFLPPDVMATSSENISCGNIQIETTRTKVVTSWRRDVQALSRLLASQFLTHEGGKI